MTTLDGALLSRGETRAWPGVEVPDDADVAQALYDHCPEMLGWQKYGLPDDLHLTDADGHMILGSITSEDDAWVTGSKASRAPAARAQRNLLVRLSIVRFTEATLMCEIPPVAPAASMASWAARRVAHT